MYKLWWHLQSVRAARFEFFLKRNRTVQTPHVQCFRRIFIFKKSRHLMGTACKHNAQRRELIEETQWQKIASLSKRPPKTPLVTCSTVITLTTPKCTRNTIFEKLRNMSVSTLFYSYRNYTLPLWYSRYNSKFLTILNY